MVPSQQCITSESERGQRPKGGPLAWKRFKEFLCLRFRWVHIRFHEWRGGESRNLLTAVVTDGWASIHHTVQLVPLLLPWTKWKPEYILPAPCTSTQALFPQSTAVPVEKTWTLAWTVESSLPTTFYWHSSSTGSILKSYLIKQKKNSIKIRQGHVVPQQEDKSSRQVNSGQPNQPKYADSLAFAWKRKLL